VITSNPNLKLTIEFTDPELEPAQRDNQAQLLMAELRDIDDVETVDRVLDSNPPAGNKAAGGFLLGLLMAQVKVDTARSPI
jgi:hypothetical protein